MSALGRALGFGLGVLAGRLAASTKNKRPRRRVTLAA